MNSSFSVDHSAIYLRMFGPPTAIGVWLPYGDGHRILFRDDGSWIVWDNCRFQEFGELLFRRVEAQFMLARNQPEGDLLALAGWGEIAPGKIVGMLLEAFDVAQVNSLWSDDRVFVPLLVRACETLCP